jgi:hypothetical protein
MSGQPHLARHGRFAVAAQVMRRDWRLAQRWSEEEARDAIDAWQGSGLELDEFAAKNGLEVIRLQRWIAKLKRSAKKADVGEQPKMLPVRIVSTVTSETEVMELVLENGVRVRVRSGFDPKALAELISAVRSC